jgi:hypothetical protein
MVGAMRFFKPSMRDLLSSTTIRQEDFHLQAARHCVLGTNCSPMNPDDTFRNGQAETGATGLAITSVRHAIEGFEDVDEF